MNPLSGVIGEAWQMYKAHWQHLLAIAFVIYLIAAILSALLGLIGTIGLYLALFVSIIAAFILQATLIKAVQDVRDGRADLSISETVNQAMPFIWSVAGASILAGLAIFVGFVLLIVPGLYLITIWAVIVPVIVIESSGALASFGRSQNLVRGRGWHVFGTLVLVYIILFVVSFILGLIFSALHSYAWRTGLSSVISGTLISPFIAVVVTLIYYRLVATAAPTPGGPYGGYGQPQGGYPGYQQPGQPYGGYQQPPQGDWQQPQQGGWQQQPPQGGWQQPPQGGWQQPQQPGGSGGDQPTQAAPGGYGGYQQPPQDSGNYGGSQQPPPPAGYGGYQQQPQQGGWEQPPQSGGYGGDQPTQQVGSYPGYQQPQPPEDSGYQQPPEDSGGYVSKEPPTRQVPRYQPPQDDDR